MKIKEVIELLKADLESTLGSLGEPEISKILDYLSDKYYNDIPVISDELFDVIKEYYEKEFNCFVEYWCCSYANFGFSSRRRKYISWL